MKIENEKLETQQNMEEKYCVILQTNKDLQLKVRKMKEEFDSNLYSFNSLKSQTQITDKSLVQYQEKIQSLIVEKNATLEKMENMNILKMKNEQEFQLKMSEIESSNIVKCKEFEQTIKEMNEEIMELKEKLVVNGNASDSDQKQSETEKRDIQRVEDQQLLIGKLRQLKIYLLII